MNLRVNPSLAPLSLLHRSYFYDAPYKYETVAQLGTYVGEGHGGETGDALKKLLATTDAAGFVRMPGGGLITPRPAAERWHGQIVVLVNRGVMSNGDMSAFCFSRLKDARVVGLEGTSGSVSQAGSKSIRVKVRRILRVYVILFSILGSYYSNIYRTQVPGVSASKIRVRNTT